MRLEGSFCSVVYLTFICRISVIALCLLAIGIAPSYGQEIKKCADKKRGKEKAMAVVDNLSEEEGKYLLGVARKTIEAELFDRKERKTSEADLPSAFREHRGTFVTLTQKGALRGCIGHIVPQEALIEGIRVNATNAAFRDPRFPPLVKNEWKGTKIEISILTEPQPVSYSNDKDLLEKLCQGVDGVIIKKGYHQATFLPQVWGQLPEKEEFLRHLCLKAGLHADEWRKGTLEVSTYQAQAFEE